MSGRTLLFVVVTVLLVLAVRLNAARVDGPTIVPDAPRLPSTGIHHGTGPAAMPALVSRAKLEPALRDPFAATRPAPTPAIAHAPSPVAPVAPRAVAAAASWPA
ncbi:MAG: hypothetical protein V4609_05375, partial [Pseudomonadota bacterium]